MSTQKALIWVVLKKDYDSNDPPLNTTQPGYNPWHWPGKGPVEAAGDGYATAGLPVIKAV